MTTGLAPADLGLELRLGRLSRESAETKGRRYLVEGRLQIVSYGSDTIEAVCRGTEETHRLGFSGGSYFCSCPAKTRCSHLVALQLVAPRPTQGGIR